MKTFIIILLYTCLSIGAAFAESTPILIGGEDTELSTEGVITGNGSSERGGLGAAVTEDFTLYYQPLGEGDWMDNVFPDEELYSFQMNIPDGLPDYQSFGVVGSWSSHGRNGEGRFPWIDEEHRWYDQEYNPTGPEQLFGLVEAEPQWTLNYWGPEGRNRFQHTCLAGTIEDFTYDEETGNATALLRVFEFAYLGYGDNNEPGPGLIEYPGGAYQGFDLNKEASGTYSHPAFFFEYDGESNSGSLTPCGTKVSLRGEFGMKGYFETIQAAIDVAEDGDTVLVQPGEYIENINFERKAIVVIGNPDDPREVIIDGNDQESVIAIANVMDGNCTIAGFTIQNGNTEDGGGIIASRVNISLRNLTLVENHADHYGGGIYLNDCDEAVIQNVNVINNRSDLDGGGILLLGSIDVIVQNVLIDNNSTYARGGGIYSFGSPNLMVLDSRITNNHTENSGGGVCADYEITIRNVLIEGNIAESDGGAFSGHANRSFNLINCTIVGNSAPAGSVFANRAPCILRVTNCIIWNVEDNPIQTPFNEIHVAYSNIENDEDFFDGVDEERLNWGEGNIDANPLFVNPDEGDFHLTADSPCIDAGDPESDPDPDGTRADMGAFYFHQVGQYIDVPDDFETIQEAIDFADNGDTVVVDEGAYVENIDFSGKNIIVCSLALIRPDDETDYAESTIIDGDSSGSVVTFANEETENAVLYGFTIRNGFVERNGGGICCANASPTIFGCYIIENHVGTRGGGISCEPNASPIIMSCVIAGNESRSGGAGIWCGEGSSPLISGCHILENEAGWNGAGINMYIECNPVVENCIIEENIANHKGGGIIVSQDCNPLISNCQILDNVSVDNGGGITVERNATPVIRNCLIEDNETEGDGGAIAVIEHAAAIILNCTFDWEARFGWYTAIFLSASSARVVNSIIYGISPLWITFDHDSAESSIMIAYSDIQDGEESIATNNNGEVHWEDGNIDADPLFIDREDGDYNLSENSPCVDAGTAFFVWEDDTLLNLSPDDYLGNAPDMGAFESEFVNVPSSELPQPTQFMLYPSYPNPFNAVTSIRYDLPKTLQVEINVYDVSGKLVANLVDENQTAGRYNVLWNVGGCSSGLYFIRLDALEFKAVNKVMLVR